MGVIIPPFNMHIIQPVRHTLAAESWSTTYAVALSGTDNPQTAINDADTVFRASFDQELDNQAEFLPAQGYFRTGGGLLELYTSTTGPTAGLSSQTSPPPQVSLVIRKRTASVGRRQRGRMFMPSVFLQEGDVDETGILTTLAVNAFQAAATAFLTNLNALGTLIDMRLLHSIPVAPDSTPVTNLLVQPIVRTQRRRLPQG